MGSLVSRSICMGMWRLGEWNHSGYWSGIDGGIRRYRLPFRRRSEGDPLEGTPTEEGGGEGSTETEGGGEEEAGGGEQGGAEQGGETPQCATSEDCGGSGDSCKELKCIDSMCVLETKDNGTPVGKNSLWNSAQQRFSASRDL